MEVRLARCDVPPTQLRERYLRSLPEPQVYYLEQRVAAARFFQFERAAQPCGYVAVNEGVIVEFFVITDLFPSLSEIFYASAAYGGATSAMVKSYDALALVAAADRPLRVATLGVNCTAWSDERYDPPAGFAARSARVADTDTILEVGPGMFETADEVVHHIATGEILIYEHDQAPVGCGVFTPVCPGAGAFDIGVGVLPAFRRKGYGELIIRHLKLHCLGELGVRPVCGCAVQNQASRRTLEKAGFISQHRLLELRW
jgi:RimJ/RimL family protein N-acetyltransferase